MQTKLLFFILPQVLLTFSVHANEPLNIENTLVSEMSHWYLGGRAGWANYQDACADSYTNCGNDVLGYGIYGGYQWTSWFALEMAATDYGSPDASYGIDHIQVDMFGGELTGVFSLGLSNELNVYARLGAGYQYTEKQLSWANKETAKEWEVVSAVGLDYRFADSWSIRGEYQFIDGVGSDDILQADLHFVSLGLTYHFGQSSHPEVASIPVIPTVVSPIANIEVQLKSRVMFGVDSNIVNSNDDLMALAKKSTNINISQLTIIGHTDNTGTNEYNQLLSEQRAQAVADYLIEQGTDGSMIKSTGLGDTSPIASNADTEGRAQNRRVEVSLQGVEQSDQTQQDASEGGQ